jgi:hypothetical protein
MRRFLKVFVLSSLACSQIWLIPLVGDHQYGHITKVQTKKKKKTKQKTSVTHNTQKTHELPSLEYVNFHGQHE